MSEKSNSFSDFSHQGQEHKSFAETALELGGKSAEEARRTGVIDEADDQVEALFAPQYQTVNSPAHRAVWEKQPPCDLFTSRSVTISDQAKTVMDQSIEVVRRCRDSESLYDPNGKITQTVFDSLAAVATVDAIIGGHVNGCCGYLFVAVVAASSWLLWMIRCAACCML